MDVEVGKFYYDKNMKWCWHVLSIDKKQKSFKYVYYPSDFHPSGSSCVRVAVGGLEIDIELEYLEITDSYRGEDLPCVDCQAFCKQKCLLPK